MLDEKDSLILDILRKDAHLTINQISRSTRIPVTTIHNRIKKLENEGIIKRYTVDLDYKKIGKEIQAYILLTVNYSLPTGKKIRQPDVARSIKVLPEVEEVKILAGITDILIRIRTRDIDELNNFVINKLREIEGVDKTQTMIVLNEL